VSVAFAIPALIVVGLVALVVSLIVSRNRRAP
jgi:hypothetical protein